MKFIQPIKEFFGEKNELVASVDMAIEERVNSPFYGYFIVSWLIVNWKLLYVAFFVSQDLILQKEGILRHQYLSSYFPSFSGINHWWHFVILPFILTFLFFWVFPRLFTRVFYRKSLRNQMALKMIELQETRKEKREENELVKEETELIKNKARQQAEIKKVSKESPEILWQKEFNEFKISSIYKLFYQLKDIVYKHGGDTHPLVGSRYTKMIDTDLLAVAHTRGLISLNGLQGSREKIELTEKGKFFMSKHLEDI